MHYKCKYLIISLTGLQDEEQSEDDSFPTLSDIKDEWFKFLQLDNGLIPAVFHSSSDDIEAVNFKKSITCAFQANFKGTNTRLEADSQSLHKSHYRWGLPLIIIEHEFFFEWQCQFEYDTTVESLVQEDIHTKLWSFQMSKVPKMCRFPSHLLQSLKTFCPTIARYNYSSFLSHHT